jgi:dGTPase
MKSCGGFEHNLQSLRVVDLLEQRYPRFDGLNLTLETREGILKRASMAVAVQMEAQEPGGPAHRIVAGEQPSLEAQLVNLADEMAYNVHDIDDGLRSGLLRMAQLEEVAPFALHLEAALSEHRHLASGSPRRLLAETLRRMLSAQVNDVIEATQAALREHAPLHARDVRSMPPLVQFSPALRQQVTALKRFLFASLYRHPRVAGTTARARAVVDALFSAYIAAPDLLPDEHRHAHAQIGARAVADYIAGMTDRFASREYFRLAGQPAFEDA